MLALTCGVASGVSTVLVPMHCPGHEAAPDEGPDLESGSVVVAHGVIGPPGMTRE